MTTKKIFAYLTILALILLISVGIVYKIKGSNSVDNHLNTGTADLSWNANNETDLAGYKVYYGTTPRNNNCPSGGYSDKADIGNKTSFHLDNLKKGLNYYFSITSYNKSGHESCFSAEVNKHIN